MAVTADTWESWVADYEAFRRAINSSRAVNVNAAALREQARNVVQQYFRQARPDLAGLTFTDSDLAELDESMQTLLRLSHGRNAKASYVRTLNAARQQSQALELERELRLGSRDQPGQPHVVRGDVESRIIFTLETLAPTAALSYEQGLRDLDADERLSYRGTANEFREALRETIDVLAPDEEVLGAPGFQLEANRTTPTHRQKVRHILRSRGLSQTARRTPEDAVSLVDELTAQVARGSYERTALSTHVASTRGEVLQMKMYVDSVLAELLEIH